MSGSFPQSLSLSFSLSLPSPLSDQLQCSHKTASVQTSAQSNSISTHLPSPNKNPNTGKHGMAARSSASTDREMEGAGGKAPQNTLPSPRVLGHSPAASLRSTNTQESLQGEGASKRLYLQ